MNTRDLFTLIEIRLSASSQIRVEDRKQEAAKVKIVVRIYTSTLPQWNFKLESNLRRLVSSKMKSIYSLGKRTWQIAPPW